MIRIKPWPTIDNPFDDAEKRAVMRVLRRGDLSGFAATIAGHRGGQEVQALEEETANAFKIRYAVAVNSATSGLICAVGALQLAKGASVAVTPYSMSASVACIVPWGLQPEFLDIEFSDYMMTRDIQPVSRACVFVDLFGNIPAEFPDTEFVIEDAAQAAAATRNGKFGGTFGDIGILSMNKYKTGGVGEGGMILTDDEQLAFTCGLIRNHGEVVTQEMQTKGMMRADDSRAVLMGYNFRLPEISAALAREQLKKLPGLVAARQDRADYLTEQLQGCELVQLPYVALGVKPAWYRYPVRVSKHDQWRVIDTLQKSGIPCKAGYVLPINQQAIYAPQPHLPAVERVETEMVLLNVLGATVERADLDDVVKVLADASR